MNLEWQPASEEPFDDPETPGPTPETPVAVPAPMAAVERPGKLGNRLRVLAALALGGLGGAAILGPIVARPVDHGHRRRR